MIVTSEGENMTRSHCRTSSTSRSDEASATRPLVHDEDAAELTINFLEEFHARLGPDPGDKRDFNSDQLSACWLTPFIPENRDAARDHYYRLSHSLGLFVWERLNWQVRALAVSVMSVGLHPPVPFADRKLS